MQVSKWGNSLAVRLPKKLVEEMGLHPGDELNIVEAAKGRIGVEKFNRRAKFLEMAEKIRISLPEDYKFDREEANKR